jgi:hypothetical protein
MPAQLTAAEAELEKALALNPQDGLVAAPLSGLRLEKRRCWAS